MGLFRKKKDDLPGCDICNSKENAKDYPIENRGFICLCKKCFEQTKKGGIAIAYNAGLTNLSKDEYGRLKK